MTASTRQKRLPSKRRGTASDAKRRKALPKLLQLLRQGWSRTLLLAYAPKADSEYSGMPLSEIEKRDPRFFD
jgi:hypothetical protein